MSSIQTLISELIDEGETPTNTGLAVSPTMAIMYADDYVRTVQFIRTLHRAILDVSQLKPETPAQVFICRYQTFSNISNPVDVYTN